MMGGTSADWRLITGRTPDPISLRGIEEAPRSAAPLAKSRSILQELEFGLTMRFVMHATDFVNRTKDPAGSIPVASTAEPAIKVNLAQRERLTRKNAPGKRWIEKE
jgi:hypothetical protein